MKHLENREPSGVVRSVDACLYHTGVIESIAGIKRVLNALLALHGALIAGVCALLLKGCA
jgi:hypothetical protein